MRVEVYLIALACCLGASAAAVLLPCPFYDSPLPGLSTHHITDFVAEQLFALLTSVRRAICVKHVRDFRRFA